MVELIWDGKKEMLKMVNSKDFLTTNKKLIPCSEESKNWDTTNNLYIEGDNLEVLKILIKEYKNKIKMIYIDPPYNTEKKLIYNDKFRKTKKECRHSGWLNMMYPRLKLAKDLLSDDGVIFISIDDNEIDNIRKVCDEVFGRSNFRNTILTRRRIKSLNSQFAENGLKSLNVGFEYVLVYAKSPDFVMKSIRMKKVNSSGKGRWDVFWSNADRPTMRYDILGFTPESGQWRYSKEKAIIAVANYQKYCNEFADKMTLEEYWEENGCCLQFIRRIPNGTGKNGGVQHWVPPSDTALRTSNWTDIEVSQIQKEIDLPFDNPKSKELIIELVKLVGEKECIIIDFFAGSATTAHAVMKLNAEDGGNRKFIMVQLPEETAENSEAYKSGYKTIAEIGKERIRRAGDKIVAETGKTDLDIGFKVFKLE